MARNPSRYLDVGAYVEDARRMVLKSLGNRIASADADLEDVMQDVYERLLRAQQSERSRWRPERGRSAASYVYLVSTSACLDTLKKQARRPAGEELPKDELVDPNHEEGSDTSAAMARILEHLDLPEEKQMATLLAEGHTLVEITKLMGLTEYEGLELRDRVRALLLEMRED